MTRPKMEVFQQTSVTLLPVKIHFSCLQQLGSLDNLPTKILRTMKLPKMRKTKNSDI